MKIYQFKYILSLVVLLFLGNSLFAQSCIKHIVYNNRGNQDTLSVWKITYDTASTTITDPRDNQSYKVVAIGNQIWMAENLSYNIPGVLSDTANPNVNSIHGRLYTWRTMMGADSLTPNNNNPSGIQGICPNGSHIPSASEWNQLEITLGLAAVDTSVVDTFRGTHAAAMKSISGWSSNSNGTNSSGFNSFPAGVVFPGSPTPWELTGTRAAFWSSSVDGTGDPYLCSNDTLSMGVERTSTNFTGLLISCRCVLNSPLAQDTSITANYFQVGGNVTSYNMSNIDSVVIIPSCSCPDSVTDSRDNQTYPLVQIGSQCWMAENLRYDIPGIYGSADTINPANPSIAYGRLYDWPTIMNGASTSSSNPSGVQGICPNGWHIPSDDEWNEMEIALGMPAADASNLGTRGTHGATMKSTTGWNNNGNGTNSSGFNAVPAGNFSDLLLNWLGNNGYFWSTTESFLPTNPLTRIVYYSGSGSIRHRGLDKPTAISCRCVKD